MVGAAGSRASGGSTPVTWLALLRCHLVRPSRDDPCHGTPPLRLGDNVQLQFWILSFYNFCMCASSAFCSRASCLLIAPGARLS